MPSIALLNVNNPDHNYASNINLLLIDSIASEEERRGRDRGGPAAGGSCLSSISSLQILLLSISSLIRHFPPLIMAEE